MEIKIETSSVDKSQYQIYTDESNGHIIAIDKDGVRKIQEAHKKDKKQEEIPDEATVKVRLLGKNKQGNYEDPSGVLHEYKIKNLKFAGAKPEWV